MTDDRMRLLLAAAIVLLVGSVLAGLFLLEPPEGSIEAILLILGVLVGSFKDVFQYNFGSSAGSKSKEQAMAATDRREDAREMQEVRTVPQPEPVAKPEDAPILRRNPGQPETP